MLLIYTGYGFLTYTHTHTDIAIKSKCKVTDFTGNDTLLLESVNLRLLDIRAAVIHYVNGYVNILTSSETKPHHSITAGVPGVHNIRRPQDMTKMHKKQLKLKGNNCR